MTCGVLIPRGNVALGKLAQALVHGATVLEIEGNFDRALELSKELAARHPVTLVNSINPFRIEGQKTAAFEIVEALGRAPDLHVMPVGNAGNITAYWKGYSEAQRAGTTSERPVMFGFQAEGAAPIVRGAVVDEPDTIATAIRIGNPASWKGALQAAEESNGRILSVTDDDIILAYRALAGEGIFVEPASAAAVAGLRRLKEMGVVPPGAAIVCVLTGNGLKDPDHAIDIGPGPQLVDAEAGAILAKLGLA
jgi:threonine synthase